MLFTTPDCLKTPIDLVKLWLHEASRVYGDKLIEDKDMETFQKLKAEVSKAGFEVSYIYIIVKQHFYARVLCELCELSVCRINLYHTMLEVLKHINKKSIIIFVERPILTDSHNFLTHILMYLYGLSCDLKYRYYINCT